MADQRLLALSRLLDASALRQQVHAANLANQNTPGYKARAVAFEDAFNQALDEGGAERAQEVEPEVYTPLATPADPDGNDVSVDREVSALAKNQMLYNAYIQVARGKMRLINTAITSAPGG